MNEPRRFLVGQIVRCPSDRGDKPYTGTVTWVGEPLQGKDYRWIEVRHPRGTKHVWPSNRLG